MSAHDRWLSAESMHPVARTAAPQLGFQLQRVRDPVVDTAVVAEVLLGRVGRPMPRLPARMRRPSGATSSDGVARPLAACCEQHVKALEATVHMLQLPHQFECETCHVVWQISLGLRGST